MNEPQATSDTRSDDPRSDDPLLRAAAAVAAVAVDSPPHSPLGDAALPNVRIGRYQIKRQIGSGGMGVVYEAIHEELGQSAALKLMRFGGATPAALERFVREARVLATCRHANVAQVYDAGVHHHGGHEIAYYVMEYVRGARMITRFATEKQLTIDQRLELFARVCDALHAVHERGVIHRDIKPENVLVDSAGQAKVIDFGVARVTSGDLPVPAHHTRGDNLVGTLQYMSPEQVGPDPGDIDRRSDVYALGLILYELLCGKRPYELGEKTLTEAMRIIREQPPAPPRQWNVTIGGDVETVLLTALHKDPDRRYPTAAALAGDVRRVLAGEPIERRRDSATYVLRTRTGALVRRHRVTTVLFAGLLAMVLTEVIGTASNRWLRSDLRFEALAIRYATAPSPPQLKHVVIIEIRSSTDFEALAGEMNVPGVSSANRPTLRAAHGRLMQRIAEGDPRSVTWDIGFRKASPTDELFCEGVKALNDKNCDVVIGGGEWSFDASGLPEMSPAIARLAYWGCTTIGASSDEPCAIHLTMRRGMEEPKQSLALATLAVYRNPKTRPYIAQDSGLAFMRLYPRVFDAASQVFVTPPAAQWTRVVLSDVADMRQDDPQNGLIIGDQLGRYVIAIPPDAVLRQSSVAYEDVMRASPGKLREWFEGKAVLIGDARPGADRWFDYIDGRRLPGYVAHAVAIDALLRNWTIRRVNVVRYFGAYLNGRYVLDFVGVVAGVMIALACGPVAWRRRVIAGAGAAVIVLGTCLTYRMTGILYNPLVAAVGLLLASELVGAANTLSARRAGGANTAAAISCPIPARS